MWKWSDKLRLGKGAFVKRRLRLLPLTDVELEADFFLNADCSTTRQERWTGLVIEREHGAVLAMEDVQWPPPTVNDLATLLAHAMLRPLDDGTRQRPHTISLRDRPQWQELLLHLRQLGIEVFLSDNLPGFDEAAIDWMQHRKAKTRPSTDEIRAMIRKPFPERKRTWFTDALEIMEWTDAMWKRAYPSRRIAVPCYDPTTVVSIRLTADELEVVLADTDTAKTKKLRSKLEAMGTEGNALPLDIHEWSQILLSLAATKRKRVSLRTHSLHIARKIANEVADVLEIDAPSF